MDKCPYRDIVPQNLPVDVTRKIIQKFEVAQCPYARARGICPDCGYEIFLDENSVYRLKANIRYKHIICLFCGKALDITKDVEVVCLAGSECLLAQEKED